MTGFTVCATSGASSAKIHRLAIQLDFVFRHTGHIRANRPAAAAICSELPPMISARLLLRVWMASPTGKKCVAVKWPQDGFHNSCEQDQPE